MPIYRVKVSLAGVVGAAAMNWYFSNATLANCNAIKTFLTAINAYIPSTNTYTIPGSGDVIDETTGQLAGGWSAGADQTAVGLASGVYSGQAGAMVRWKTSGVVDGHHPVGRAILVPLSSVAFNSSGVLGAAAVTTITGAASSLIAATTGFVVWHRPVYDHSTTPPTLKRPGAQLPVISASMTNVPATLRSRAH